MIQQATGLRGKVTQHATLMDITTTNEYHLLLTLRILAALRIKREQRVFRQPAISLLQLFIPSCCQRAGHYHTDLSLLKNIIGKAL
jgi:hypothetical protein